MIGRLLEVALDQRADGETLADPALIAIDQEGFEHG